MGRMVIFVALHHLLRDALQAFGQFHIRRHLAGHGEAVHVGVLDQAGLLDVALVTRRVPGHQQHGAPEALDEQAAFLVGGEGLRAAQGLVAAAADEIAGGIEEGGGGLLVVEHVEGAEPADAFVVDLVVAVVDEGGDGADRLRAAPGDEVLALHVAPGGASSPCRAVPPAWRAAAAPTPGCPRARARGSRRRRESRPSFSTLRTVNASAMGAPLTACGARVAGGGVNASDA